MTDTLSESRPAHTVSGPQSTARPVTEVGPRLLGRFNLMGLWTLYLKEVRRFLNVLTQTVVAPVIMSLLFLAVFTLALGRGSMSVAGIPYPEFLAPGLIMMQMLQNAFANTSSSLVIAKVQGNIVDVLMPPLSPGELTLGYVGGGMTRGLLVGVAAAIAIWPFIGYGIHDPLAILYYGLSASMMLSLLGILGGVWADKFDHIAAVTNFVIMPLSFLSGTFYSVERLPENWVFVAHLNPFFYLIDGFRYGIIGHSDSPIWLGALIVAVVNILLWTLTYRMLATGYKLKP